MVVDNELYCARFYWGARKETVTQCAQRLKRFLHALCKFNVGFSYWNTVDDRKLDVHSTTEEELSVVLSAGQNLRDFGGSPIPRLGFSITLVPHNRQARVPYLRLLCGAYSDRVPNHCLFEGLSVRAEPGKELIAPGVSQRLCVEFINAWQPDYGFLTSTQIERRVPLKSGRPNVGWITYFSNRIAKDNVFSNSVTIDAIDDGILLTAARHVMSGDRDDDVAVLRQLNSLVS